MANDFKRKEPSKTEKVLYELMMAQQSMERGLWSNSSVVMAIAVLTNIDPAKVAELLVNDEKIKEYSKQVNEEIKKLEDAKRGTSEPSEIAESHEGHNHAEGEHEAEAGTVEVIDSVDTENK